MDRSLAAAMGIFYLLATGLMIAAFSASTDRSPAAIAGWVNLYLASVILPAWWTAALARKIQARLPLTRDLQIVMVMPGWCATVAALIALRLVP